MKAFNNPPKDIEMVFFCVLNLLAGFDKAVPVDKNNRLKTENVWKSSLALMSNPQALIATLEGYKDKIKITINLLLFHCFCWVNLRVYLTWPASRQGWKCWLVWFFLCSLTPVSRCSAVGR